MENVVALHSGRSERSLKVLKTTSICGVDHSVNGFWGGRGIFAAGGMDNGPSTSWESC